MAGLLGNAVRVALCALLLSQSSFAFETQLSDEAVREAYFLGQRNNESTSAFLKQYSRALPRPDRGPYVSKVWLLTPYAQVVRTSALHSVGYSAQQASAGYHGLGDTLLLEIRVDFTPTYNFSDAQRTVDDLSGELNRALEPEDFWRAFRITLSQPTQKDQPPQPREVRSLPIYDENGSLAGVNISMEYDANAFESLAAKLEILIPGVKPALASFPLDKLR